MPRSYAWSLRSDSVSAPSLRDPPGVGRRFVNQTPDEGSLSRTTIGREGFLFESPGDFYPFRSAAPRLFWRSSSSQAIMSSRHYVPKDPNYASRMA